MRMVNVLLPLIIAAIALALLALKSNAIYVFFALCAGNTLVQFANRNMAYVNGHLNNQLSPHGFTISKPSIEIVILLLPPVLVTALAKHNNGPAKWPLQTFPAIATGILTVLFVVPLLPLSTQHSITQNKIWSLLEQNQVPVVAICVLATTILLIITTYSHGHASKKHQKHKL